MSISSFGEAHAPVILAIDNGGTNTRVAESAETIAAIESYPTPLDYEQAIKDLGATSRLVLGSRQPDAVGISVAGAVDLGVITQAGELQKRGWVGKPFAEDLAAEMGLSPDAVVLLNDCAAGAVAERTSRQHRTGAFMVLSTGLGGAIYTEQQIIPDEPGHKHYKPGAVCGDGQDGHAEAFISGSGIERRFGVRGEDIPHDDPRWQTVKSDFHEIMAQTLARYKESLGLELGIVGFTGSVALGGPNMLSDLNSSLRLGMGLHSPMIREAVYKDESGLYGAGFFAAEFLEEW